MKKRLGVMLGDVISSRRIEARNDFRVKLKDACNEVNSRFRNYLFADFKILKGLDEIGGVFTGIAPVYKIISLINEELRPASMNFAFVYDYVDTALETRDTAMMDGPAFHKAAGEMIKLKGSNLMFFMACQEKIIDSAMTGQINLLLLMKKHWSDKQHKVVRQYEKVKNQWEVAEQLNITQQAVSQTLRGVMWKEISAIEKEINSNLEHYEKMLPE